VKQIDDEVMIFQ
jgi:hypothetical protein